MGIFAKMMTKEQLQERIKEWAEEMALSTDERHRKVCSEQIARYREELERRKESNE